MEELNSFCSSREMDCRGWLQHLDPTPPFVQTCEPPVVLEVKGSPICLWNVQLCTWPQTCPSISRSKRHVHATVQSMTRPLTRSLANRNLLDDDLTSSLLLLPTVIRSAYCHGNFWDLKPFLFANSPALTFTHPVLLVKGDSNDNEVFSEE